VTHTTVLERRRAAMCAPVIVLAIASAGAPAVAADAVACGTARPSLEAIPTAEGLAIGPDGTIYFSQPFVGANTQFLGRYRPPYDRPPETRWVDLGGNALGIALDPQKGVLYAGSRSARKLFKVTLTDPPAVAPLADAEEGINGVTLGADGAVYYSDQTGGHLYRVTAAGAKSRITTSPITEPNGIAFGPDGRLYVVSWATTDVTRLDLAAGAETGRERFATLPQTKADGIAFDAKGRAYVTAASVLHEISPDGREVKALGATAGANVEFGAGLLSCSDMYVAGNGQGVRLFAHDTPGLDVPWHHPPANAFPGQFAWAPADWRFPTWPSGCNRFTGDDKTACLEFVSSDYGRLSRYAAANAALAPPRAGETRVVFFGDSITDNWSKPAYGPFFAGKPYVNRGIGGQTTSQMLVRFAADVVALRPAVVVILAGTNDIAGNSGPVSLETIERNLATMAELAKLHGIRVVLASLLPVSDDKRDPMGRPVVRTQDRPTASLRTLNAWMAEHARAHGYVSLDYFSALADAGGALRPELTEDGLHPNAAGYAVMAPLAEKAIQEALGR
jgi:lysophospholipase L1-like esterase/streptogramin lyase